MRGARIELVYFALIGKLCRIFETQLIAIDIVADAEDLIAKFVISSENGIEVSMKKVTRNGPITYPGNTQIMDQASDLATTVITREVFVLVLLHIRA